MHVVVGILLFAALVVFAIVMIGMWIVSTLVRTLWRLIFGAPRPATYGARPWPPGASEKMYRPACGRSRSWGTGEAMPPAGGRPTARGFANERTWGAGEAPIQCRRPNCLTENQANARFCRRCGGKLAAAEYRNIA